MRSPPAPLEEPLELSAPLAARLAPQLCRREAQDGESCAWYHGFWQYLRLLGMGTSPAGHAEFFGQAFAMLPAKRARILIAGGADYSMLGHAAAACRTQGVQAEFTMVDWCETPLALSRWYAERAGLVLQTARRNLLEPDVEGGFDAACTHALLGHFRRDERPRLLAGLHRALRPGGLLFLANRLRPGAGDAPAAFDAAQADAFVAEVVRKAGQQLPGVDLAEAARAYAARQLSWPVGSLDEVRVLFEDAGFRLEGLSSAPMARAQTSLNLPTVAGGADYARIVAVKR